MTDRPRNILVSRTDRLGDLVLALPAATAIKQAFPGAAVHFLTAPYTAPVAALCPDVAGVLHVDDRGRIAPAALRRFDAAILLYPRPGLAWACLRAGIPLRIGTAFRFYSLFYNRRVRLHRRRSPRHEAELNLELLRPLGIAAPEVRFRLRIPDDLRQHTDRLLETLGIVAAGPYVIIHPGSGGSAGNWPSESFGELAGHLARRRGCRVLVTGAAHEADLAAHVARIGGAGVASAAGRFSLPEFAAVLARSDLAVGNSSGPLHLARALGADVLGIYPGDRQCGPDRWGPYGRPDAVITPDNPPPAEGQFSYDERCAQLAAISVERVLAHLEQGDGVSGRTRRASEAAGEL